MAASFKCPKTKWLRKWGPFGKTSAFPPKFSLPKFWENNNQRTHLALHFTRIRRALTAVQLSCAGRERTIHSDWGCSTKWRMAADLAFVPPLLGMLLLLPLLFDDEVAGITAILGMQILSVFYGKYCKNKKFGTFYSFSMIGIIAIKDDG